MPVSAALGVALVAALSWAWFLLRDVTGVVGDVLAILLVPVVVGLAVVGVVAAGLRKQRRWWVVIVSVPAMGAVAVAVSGPWLASDSGTVAPSMATTLATANVRHSAGAAGALLASSPDVLVVPEMTLDLDPALADAYPYRHLALTTAPDIAVYSRFPIRVLDEPGPGLPGLRVEVTGLGGRPVHRKLGTVSTREPGLPPIPATS